MTEEYRVIKDYLKGQTREHLESLVLGLGIDRVVQAYQKIEKAKWSFWTVYNQSEEDTNE